MPLRIKKLITEYLKSGIGKEEIPDISFLLNREDYVPLTLPIDVAISERKDQPDSESFLFNRSKHLYRKINDNSSFAACKAIIICGKYFEEEKWRLKGEELFLNRLHLYSARDGGCFEGTLAQQAALLKDILDIIKFHRVKNKAGQINSFIAELQNFASRILFFLQSLSYRNGTLLFSKGHYDNLNIETLSDYSSGMGIFPPPKKNTLLNFSRSGFYGIKEEGLNFIIRGGRAGREYAESLFAYELCVRGEKFISSPPRGKQDVLLDGDLGLLKNIPGDIRFEEGRRLFFNCSSVRVGGNTEETSTFYFSGIRRGNEPGDKELLHKREIYYDDNASLVTVKDIIRGNKKYKAESFLYLSPDAYIRINGQQVLLKKGGAIMVISSANDFSLNDHILVFRTTAPSVIEYKLRF